MITKVKIKSAKNGDFNGDNGVIKYMWYKAEVLGGNGIEPAGFNLEFGSRDKTHVEGKEYDLDLGKEPKFNKETGVQSGFKYKEFVEL